MLSLKDEQGELFQEDKLRTIKHNHSFFIEKSVFINRTEFFVSKGQTKPITDDIKFSWRNLHL